MFKLKEQWQQSSLTQKVFRELQSTRYHVFDYWRKHYLPLNRQMERFKREGINTIA